MLCKLSPASSRSHVLPTPGFERSAAYSGQHGQPARAACQRQPAHGAASLYQGGCQAREGAIYSGRVAMSGAPFLTAPAVASVRKRDQSSARRHRLPHVRSTSTKRTFPFYLASFPPPFPLPLDPQLPLLLVAQRQRALASSAGDWQDVSRGTEDLIFTAA
jgi:hypothetical protein